MKKTRRSRIGLVGRFASGRGDTMRVSRNFLQTFAAIVVLAVLPVTPTVAFAHCDGMDGPVVKAAREALSKGDINLVLIWIKPKDEPEVRQAFGKTLAVRKLSADAQDLADRYFFETLVRLHRAGEGAAYTGLKPSGRDLGPAIPAADRALEEDSIEPVLKLLNSAMDEGVREQFKKAAATRKFPTDDVAAGREYVRSYVEYVHYIESLYNAAKTAAHGHYEENSEGGDHR
jgi:hypothetical protein